jgi:hypothetical protein
MIGSLLALLLAAQPAHLGQYREIVMATWWTGCCAGFPGGVPDDIGRRIERVSGVLERRYGHEAVATLEAEVHSEFNGRLALYDPVGRRLTPRQQQRARRTVWRWYDARLDAIEARLGLTAR